jgi:2'-5' RNA ligase
MRVVIIHCAIVPPRVALEAVDAVVRSVPVPDERAAGGASKGLLGRLGRHRADPTDGPEGPTMLEHLPVDEMRLPVTGFGNLTTHDAQRVSEVIREAAAEWVPATVRFAGGTALDFPDDWSVWARLEGEVDGLNDVGRGVPKAVERLGFFVDRRSFRPMLSVATVTRQTTGPFLQDVVDALDAFRGEEWPVEVSMLRESVVEGRTELTEVERIVPGR